MRVWEPLGVQTTWYSRSPTGTWEEWRSSPYLSLRRWIAADQSARSISKKSTPPDKGMYKFVDLEGK